MFQLVKQITAAGAVSISQTNTITTRNSKALCLCMVPIHMGVSNHWNGIRTGLEWNGTIQNSEIMG